MLRHRIVPAATAFMLALLLKSTSGALARDELRQEHLPVGSIHVTAEVVDSGGAPVAGAVVVTSAGGQGVTGDDGVARFAVDALPWAHSINVTAVAVVDGVNHVGSIEARLGHHRDIHRHEFAAGEIVLHADGECEPKWLPTFGGQPGVNEWVLSFTVFDDGSGQALYAGGMFTTAGGTNASCIAKWDGHKWSPVGGGMSGGGWPYVAALTVFDDGSGPALYAGGRFTAAGDTEVNHIAKWDGHNWSALNDGMNDEVNALMVLDDPFGSGPALYVGGSFTTAGGVPAKRIAKWDGHKWASLGDGIGSNGWEFVAALTVFDDGLGPALYAGGVFTSAGDIDANHVATWDGNSWSPLGSGVSGGMNTSVRALTAFDDSAGPALYVGGDFTTAGNVEVNNIAKWDGQTWSALGSGVVGFAAPSVWTLMVFDDGSGTGPALYAGGLFATAGGVAANSVASWDGEQWSALSSGTNSWVFAITDFNDGSGPTLFVGGAFTVAGGLGINRVAKWTERSWSPLGGGLNNAVHVATVFDDGSGPALYVGGQFITAGGVQTNRIAKWDGRKWASLGDGIASNGWGFVAALTVFDDGLGPALYAGGVFTTAGDIDANHIAKWDGQKWSPLSSGVSGGPQSSIRALTVFDDGSGPALYAGGGFDTAGGVDANGIARWDGQKWSAVGSGTTSGIFALVVFDDGAGSALYAGGWFTSFGDAQANFIAKWDGKQWYALGSGVAGVVNALAVLDDGSGSGSALIAGGEFITAGGVTVNRIAKWDGTEWLPLGSGVSFYVFALAAFNDGLGTGPSLYAGGQFTTAGGVTANRIARWDGQSWSPLDDGVNSPVYALAVSNDDADLGTALYVGGQFTVSPASDSFLARWQGCPTDSSIPGDLNNDGVVNVTDLLLLLGQWGDCASCTPGNCPADLNGDCTVNVTDLLLLLGNWG